jgi:hypothetical protein
VLDVAAGSGNTALRAAEAGATVVASDLTPENFAAGRLAAQRAGLPIDWVEADAEDLPFADAEFGVVTSSVGAMWAPDHQRVADELLRVCRPGGTIGMINFAADGLLAGFLDVFADYAPPPPPWGSSPLLWGDPDHLRQLFGDRVSTLEISPAAYTERVSGGPAGIASTTSKPSGRSPRSTPRSQPNKPPPWTANSWPSRRETTPAPQADQQNWTTSTSASSPAPRRANSKHQQAGSAHSGTAQRVGDQHDAEQRVVRLAHGQDHGQQDAQDQVEPGQDVRAQDVGDRAAGVLPARVRQPARAPLGNLHAPQPSRRCLGDRGGQYRRRGGGCVSHA